MCMPGAGDDSMLSPVKTTAQMLPTQAQADSSARLNLLTKGAGVITQAAGSFARAQADRAAALTNKRIAAADEASAILRGDQAMQRNFAATAKLKGEQRTALAANGIDLQGGGLPSDILASTDLVASMDRKTISENAKGEMEAARMKSSYYDAQASASNPLISAGTSLIGGAGKVADRWYDYKKSGALQSGFFGKD